MLECSSVQVFKCSGYKFPVSRFKYYPYSLSPILSLSHHPPAPLQRGNTFLERRAKAQLFLPATNSPPSEIRAKQNYFTGAHCLLVLPSFLYLIPYTLFLKPNQIAAATIWIMSSVSIWSARPFSLMPSLIIVAQNGQAVPTTSGSTAAA